MQNLPSMNTGSIKSFWERPEGKTGMVFMVAIIAGAIWGLGMILPFIITMMANTITAIFLGLALFGLAYVILDKKVQTLVGYLYRTAMRSITGFFIKLDPIAIIETYIDGLKENLSGMDKQITNLKGQMRALADLIKSNEENMRTNLQKASYAQQKGMASQSVLQARKAGRLEKSNVTLQELYTKMEKMYRVLTKMHESASLLVEDMSDEVQVKKKEQKAILAGHSAFKSAMKIISGDPDKVQMFNQANEFLAEDLGNKVGEMERFMEISANFMDSVDLQNGIFEEKGLQMLEEWEKGGTSFLLGESKSTLLLQAENPHDVLDLDSPLKSSTNKYKNMV